VITASLGIRYDERFRGKIDAREHVGIIMEETGAKGEIRHVVQESPTASAKRPDSQLLLN
jgi:hypothetical protein